jgi:hypothetical protein
MTPTKSEQEKITMDRSRKTSSASRSSSRQSRAKKPATKHSLSQASSAHERHQMIAEAAYYRAECRGLAGGDPVADWLAAEAELNDRLTTTR